MAWRKSAKLRVEDKARDQKYPAFSRTDVYRLKKWKLYLGALTIMPIRFAIALANYIVCFILLSIGMFGYDIEKQGEMTRFQSFFSKLIIGWIGTFQCFMAGVTVELREVNFDYSKWLGPKYETKEKCGTYIANHVGFLDPDCMLWALKGNVTFAAAEFTKNLPVYGKFIAWQNGDFVKRGDEKATLQTINKWTERADKIEKGESEKRPLLIFPDSYHNNGTHICDFKKGVFYNLRSVRPFVLDYQSTHIMPTTVALAEFSLMILLWCSVAPVRCVVYMMPVFTPNEHLFAQHPGKEKWEVYRQAVREAMSECSGFPLNDHKFADIQAYWDMVGYKKLWQKKKQ